MPTTEGLADGCIESSSILAWDGNKQPVAGAMVTGLRPLPTLSPDLHDDPSMIFRRTTALRTLLSQA